MNTSTLTPTDLVNKLTSEIKENNKNNISKVKLLKKVVHKMGLKLADESILLDLSKGLDNNQNIMESFKISKSAIDIQNIYDDSFYGYSCMSVEGRYAKRGRLVGDFYAKHNIMLASINGARGLINPQNKSFYKTYGENWFILAALLVILGYKENYNWLEGVKIEVITNNKKVRCFTEEKKYIENNKNNEFGEYAYFRQCYYDASDYLDTNNKDKIKLKNISNNIAINYNHTLVSIINNKTYDMYFDSIVKKYYIYKECYYYTDSNDSEDPYADQTPYLDGNGYGFKYIKGKEKFNTYKEKLIIKINEERNEEINYEKYLPKIRSKYLAKYNKKCREKNKKNKYL